jgi:drug/metabolite transporter (DMT)-like permease
VPTEGGDISKRELNNGGAESIGLGAVFALSAFLWLAAMGAFAKVAGEGVPAIVIVFWQNLISFIFVAPVALRHGIVPLKTNHFRLHLLRALAGSIAWFGLFAAISMMPLANAVLLTYSAPLWMPLIGWIVLRQTVSGRLLLSMVVGFVGILLVLHPGGDEFNIGALFAIGAAVCLAVALMSVRWLGATEPVLRILFFFFLLSTVLVSPFAFFAWGPIEGTSWLYLFAVGLCLLVSQSFIALAYLQASAVRLGPLLYSVIVFTALIDWLVWSRPPTLSELAGMALVISGGIIAVVRPSGSR